MTAWRDFKQVVSKAKVSPQGSLVISIGPKNPLVPFISYPEDEMDGNFQFVNLLSAWSLRI